jgi:adenine-specific DNA-methyltransferase
MGIARQYSYCRTGTPLRRVGPGACGRSARSGSRASESNPVAAAIFIGPEFGTLTRTDITAAAREAADARFDALIACAFSYDAHASELARLGRSPS